MIDHISVAVSDLGKSAAFYDPLFATLGMTRVADREHSIGYGKRYPEFWLNARPRMAAVATDTGIHICLRARTTDIVDAFHAAALAHGGSCDGAPGPRQGEKTAYYGAFVRDPDGNKIEVATFPPKDGQ
jgi:catechol 2,3-dioxygenase-like lactoylglutathione lyase family enzyme